MQTNRVGFIASKFYLHVKSMLLDVGVLAMVCAYSIFSKIFMYLEAP